MTSNSFDVKEFDGVVEDALNPHSATHKLSEQKLLTLRSDPNSLYLVDDILQKSNNVNSHFLALQIVEETIKNRWSLLDDSMQTNLAIYVIKHIQSVKSRVIHRKLNECLVMVLKLEYPNKFSTFIADIVNESLKDVSVCLNAFDLLNLFNFEMRRNLPSFRKRIVVDNFRREFFHVYNLVSNVLLSCDVEEVMRRCLDALEGFLMFFSVQHLIDCDLIEKVCNLVNSNFSTPALKVLAAIFEKRNEVFKMNEAYFCENCEMMFCELSKEDSNEKDLLLVIQESICNKSIKKPNAQNYHLLRQIHLRSKVGCLNMQELANISKNAILEQNLSNNLQRKERNPESSLSINRSDNKTATKKANILTRGVDGGLPDPYFIQNYIYPQEISTCVECAYLATAKEHFLLSPSVKYTMLTNEDISNLPALHPKLKLIHKEVVSFLEMYFNKFQAQNQRLSQQYHYLDPVEKEFINSIAKILISFYETNLFTGNEDFEFMKKGLLMLLKIMKVDDQILFRMIVDFFYKLTSNICLSNESITKNISKNEISNKNNNSRSNMMENNNNRSTDFYYNNINTCNDDNMIGRNSNFYYSEKVSSGLSKTIYSLIEVLIKKMPRPEDVYITKNEFGEAVKERITETDQLEFITIMQNTLRNCTLLHKTYVTNSLSSKISTLSSMKDSWSHDLLNTVCWAAGAVSGIMEADCSFFTEALKELLAMCEKNCSKHNKAIIAGNILFLVSSFDHYLETNDRFLKTVVRKLFEFMEETHEGVQEMAVDVYLKISRKIRMHHLIDNGNPFLQVILHRLLPREAQSLPLDLRRGVYEALLHSLAKIPGDKVRTIEELFNNHVAKDLKAVENAANNSYIINSHYNSHLNSNFGNSSNVSAEASLSACAVNMSAILSSPASSKALAHVLKTYTLLFKIIPESAQHEPFVLQHFAVYNALVACSSSTADLLISVVLKLFSQIISVCVPTKDFCERLFSQVLVHSHIKNNPAYFELAEKIISRCAFVEALRNINNTQRNNLNIPNSNNQSIHNHSIGNIFSPNSINSFNNSSINNSSINNFPNFSAEMLDKAFSADQSYYITRDTFIIEKIIQPALIIDPCQEFFLLIKSLLKHSKFFFHVLFSNQQVFTALFEKTTDCLSILLLSTVSFETLILFLSEALRTNTFAFFNSYFISTLETVLAASLDKENSPTLDLQAAVIGLLLNINTKIPQLESNVDNALYLKKYILNLFSTNFNHIQTDIVNLFIDGLFLLKENHLLLKDHIVDFRFKVENMFLKSNIQDEEEILKERIAMCSELQSYL